MNEKDILVLIVEDEPQMQRFLRASLTSHGFQVREALSGATAVTDFDHNATGGSQIANWTRIGSATVYGYGNAYNQPGNDGFTWSNGAPLAVAL